jgi:acyl CoA:acetate/3-ketoacid CoA transferase alpha subunit
MEVFEEGSRKIIAKNDPEEHREWVLKNKPRALVDKVMGIDEAISKYVKDGDYLEYGFFGTRISMVAIYEIIRQKKKNLNVGRGGVFELDLLSAAGIVKTVERGYGGGFEVRGLGPAFRRAVESGKIDIIEWTNTAHALRLRAAAMGIPFIPTRSMLGTDTLKYSAAKVVRCPFTGKKVCLLPALYPDVGLIHVQRCDKYGNAQIDGAKVMDIEIAMAARRVILTTEKIVDTEVFRKHPERTDIPYFYVDAVVEVPFGSHPSNVPGLYYMDEEFIAEWLREAKTEEGAEKFLEKYIYGYDDFEEYLEMIGGIKKLNYLMRLEQFRETLKTPWADE